jgi:hypothetical protein
MSELIRLGGMDDHQHLAEELCLPILTHLSAHARVMDAMDHVATTRRGIGVIGRKGVGKTVGLQAALQNFEESERKKLTLDASYQKRTIVELSSLRAKTYRDAVIMVLKFLAGSSFALAARGRRKTDDELREEIVHHCLDQKIIALCLDEAENAQPVTLMLLRDIMSDAERLDPARLDAKGQRSAGVGVLLLGTHPLAHRLRRSVEAGERWVQLVTVGRVRSGVVAEIYEAWFPGFAEHIAAVGRAAWLKFLEANLSEGRSVSLRLVENHARLYFRRMVRKDDSIRSRELTPFSERVFLWTLGEVRWGEDGDDNRGASHAA